MESYRLSRPMQRIVRRSAGTRLMAKIYGVIQQPLDEWVYRHSRGVTTASSWLAGVDIAMLTTKGARTGLPRTRPVLGLRDGADIILIASNFGRPRNPSWYHNLRANPHATIVIHGVSHRVTARELSGPEREWGFRRGEEVYPGFAHYRRWASNRQIPVLRLEPLERVQPSATPTEEAEEARPPG